MAKGKVPPQFQKRMAAEDKLDKGRDDAAEMKAARKMAAKGKKGGK